MPVLYQTSSYLKDVMCRLNSVGVSPGAPVRTAYLQSTVRRMRQTTLKQMMALQSRRRFQGSRIPERQASLPFPTDNNAATNHIASPEGITKMIHAKQRRTLFPPIKRFATRRPERPVATTPYFHYMEDLQVEVFFVTASDSPKYFTLRHCPPAPTSNEKNVTRRPHLLNQEHGSPRIW